MKEFITILIIAPFAVLFVFLIYWAVFRISYLSKYVFMKGKHRWSRCDKCKKAEPTMYYKYAWHGVIYECNECAFKK